MAERPEIGVGSSTAPRGTKRQAEGPDEAPNPNKPFHLSPRPEHDTPSNARAEGETTIQTAPVQTHNLPLSQDAIIRLQANYIDDAHASKQEEAEREAFRNSNRKLRWNLNIDPNDDEWKSERAKFRKLLATGSVASVLEAEFDEGQKLLLIPPFSSGSLLQVQLENTRDYRAFFERGARFNGVSNNLATKLTMLKFGLPVEPVTLKNIERCGNDADEDDPPDDPEGVPRVQRIMYSEKPLQFLDSYHERSYGYPILRSKSPYAVNPLAQSFNKTRTKTRISTTTR
jgi:hypothetical protein